jgi:2-methylcitrate dehydratase PrpD
MNSPEMQELKARELISTTLAAFVSGFEAEQLPDAASERAKLLMLDAIGIAFASTRFEFAQRTLAALSDLGQGDAEVIGFEPKLDLRNAALLNGILVHGLDYDDTYLPGQVHLTASCVPTALALGAHKRASGKEMLVACALGLEMGARIGVASNGGFLRAGFHATGVIGTFAATLAAGRLMKMSAPQLALAQGIALSMASGTIQPIQEGSWTKRMHPGWAATSGITAAALARQGFVGPSEAYEGRYGFYPQFLGEHFKNADLGLLTQGLGEKWEFPRASIKLYPACHQSHAFFNAALKLSREHKVRAEDIKSIRTLVASAAVPLVCEPLEAKRAPTSSYSAQFSLPYGLACCFARGKFGLGEIEESSYSDPALLSLARKVNYEIDPNSGFPKFRSGEVIIDTKDGRTLSQREELLPDEPASQSEIVDKFMANAESVMSAVRAREIKDAILNLEQMPDCRELTAMLRG